MTIRGNWRSYPSRAAARRAAARHLHPDRGGDPAQFVRALEQIDRQFASSRSDQFSSEIEIVDTRSSIARHAALFLAHVRHLQPYRRKTRYITL